MTALAVDTAVVLAGLAFLLGVVVLVLLVWAPWNSVRNEPPLPDDVETRLLLGEDPAQIAADQDAAEARARRTSVVDLSLDRPDEDDGIYTSAASTKVCGCVPDRRVGDVRASLPEHVTAYHTYCGSASHARTAGPERRLGTVGNDANVRLTLH